MLIPYMVAVMALMVLQAIAWIILFVLLVSDLIRWCIQWEGAYLNRFGSEGTRWDPIINLILIQSHPKQGGSLFYLLGSK